MTYGNINTKRTWGEIAQDLKDEMRKWRLIEDYRLSSYRDAMDSGEVSLYLQVRGEWQEPITCKRFGSEDNGAQKNLLAIVIEIKHQRLADQRGLSNVVRQVTKAVGALPDSENPYHILGITPEATQNEIREAWRITARRYHPDSNNGKGDLEMFKRARLAAEKLGVA